MGGIVHDTHNPCVAGAMGATEDFPLLAFHPVPEDPAAAETTGRCECVCSALE
jgi:hypothetical protein